MKQQVIVVLGMHRSGTSAVTRGLQALGVELGDRMVPAAADNPKGFWEHQGMVNVNRRCLSALGVTWDACSLIPPAEWESPVVKDLQSVAKDVIRRNFGDFAVWGF